MDDQTQSGTPIPQMENAVPVENLTGGTPLERIVVDRKWEQKFRLLAEFKERTGHCNISPHDKEHRGLLKWSAVQRTARKDGVLNPEHARRLDELGFDWTIVDIPDLAEDRKKTVEELWQRRFDELLAFKERFGHGDVPKQWQENPSLANWVIAQRMKRKRRTLKAERERHLDEAGFNWSSEKTEIDRKWDRRFQQLVEYKQKFGNCSVPCKWEQDRPFSHWVHNQRGFRHKGLLSEERIRKLEEIGFAWHGACRISFSNVEIWNRRYAQLKKFHKRFGHCEVPANWKKNLPLARWVGVQRALQSTGKLDEKRKQRLDAIDFTWREPRRSLNEHWERRFQELLKYKERFGDCQVPVRWKDNAPLGHWVEIQRAWHRQGKVRADRVKRLEEIGFQWAVAPYFNGSRKDHWEKRCAELEDYKKRFGHYDVPTNWPENPDLSKWVMRQRHEMLFGPISEDRKRLLEAVGFARERTHTYLKDLWDRRFQELLAYKSRFGHCNVPARWKENTPLGHWVEVQRAFRRKGKLGAERIRRLDEAGFEWDRGEMLAQTMRMRWEQRFSELAEFKNRFGHCNVTNKRNENHILGGWVQEQRTSLKKGRISAERKARLDALEFAWLGESRAAQPGVSD